MSASLPHFAQTCPQKDCSSLPVRIVRVGFSRPSCANQGLPRQRYLCKHCGKKFSANVHSLDYRCKNPDPALSSKIFSYHVHGLSGRSIARLLRVSEHCVRIRLHKMSLWAFDFQAHKIEGLSILEPICMDGLENFAGSQYDPNYINQAIGRDSLFVYDFNFSPLNRKGRMSAWQKGTLAALNKHEGRYNPRSIRLATVDLLSRLYKKWGQSSAPMPLISDEHFQYRRAVEKDLISFKIEHVTISSKATRNFQNILFPVNHADLMIRQRLAAFSRETISFSKTHGRMCQRYMLFALYKNYMSPQFTKQLVTRPLAHERSPAQVLGIEDRILTFSEVFSAKVRKLSRDKSKDHMDWSYFREAKVPPKYLRSKKYA